MAGAGGGVKGIGQKMRVWQSSTLILLRKPKKKKLSGLKNKKEVDQLQLRLLSLLLDLEVQPGIFFFFFPFYI